MLRYAFYLITGTGIASYISIPIWISCSVFISFLSYLIYVINRDVSNYKIHLSITISLMVLSLGIIRETCWMASTLKRSKAETMRITSFPQFKNHSIQFEASEVNKDCFLFTDAEQFIVSCKDTNAVLHYGDILRVTSQPVQVESDALPFQFDYAAYLKSRGIMKRITLCHAEKLPDHSLTFIFYTWINKSRTQFKTVTSEIFHTQSAKGLAESLLLGYKEDLDSSTKDVFQKSGVSHLLAVSGMHTALIYEILFLLFIPLGTSQRHRFVFLFIALFVLGYFTILSGCSASVIRSAIMCSVVAIGYAFRKKGNGLNALGISICVIIGWAPYQLWDLGFQLSVLAVFGILTLHSILSKQFEQLHIVPKYLLNATSITVCAQIMTLPVILYHFHLFPIYFIPANLILIPISTLALFFTMFSITVASIGFHIDWIFQINQWIIELFETCTAYLAALPGSILYPVSFSKPEFVIVVLLICSYLFIHPLKKAGIIYISFLCILWCGLRLYHEHVFTNRNQNLFICNSKKSAMLTIHGMKADLYCLPFFKSSDVKNIQEYFNLYDIQMHVITEERLGITWKYDNNHAAWLLKRKTVATDKSFTYLFSYQATDTGYYKSRHHQNLRTKSMIYLK